jgi:DNA adenine methylase
VTYDNTPEIQEMYSWAFGIYDKEWNYTINRTDDQRKNGNKDSKGERYKGKEVFIVNYPSVVPVQLELFKLNQDD